MKLETKKKIRNYFNIGRKSKPLDSVSEFSELKFTFFTLATELMHKAPTPFHPPTLCNVDAMTCATY